MRSRDAAAEVVTVHKAKVVVAEDAAVEASEAKVEVRAEGDVDAVASVVTVNAAVVAVALVVLLARLLPLLPLLPLPPPAHKKVHAFSPCLY